MLGTSGAGRYPYHWTTGYLRSLPDLPRPKPTDAIGEQPTDAIGEQPSPRISTTPLQESSPALLQA